MEDGQEFEGYRIVREIGRGAMAVVYEAVQLDLRRKVALKVLHAGFAGDVKAVRRFLREAESAGKLKHPNIVAIHRRGRSAKGVPFIAMDLAEGPSLAELVRHLRGLPPADGRPPVPDDLPGPETPDGKRIEVACRIGAQIADALHHAHGQGVSHRDIKPGNVLLQSGQPVVTDFGLAGVLWGGESQLTRTGEVLGTPAYMSPEQARGDETDHRTDVYSLGAMLYELIALRQSIDAGSLQDFLHRIPVEEPTPIRKLVPAASRDLETVLARAMAKEPDRRYRSAAEFRDDLQGLLVGGPIRARPDGPVRKLLRRSKQRPKTTLVLATSVVALLGTIALVILWPEDPTISRLIVRTHDGRRVPVRLVPVTPEGHPLWKDGQPLGTTGDARHVVRPGEYWLLVGDENAYAEPLVEIGRGEQVERVVRLLPLDEVARGMKRFEAGDYRWVSTPVRPFLIDAREVSVGDFLQYLAATGKKYRWPDGKPPENHRLPMTMVTVDDAEGYASWAGKRLPTSREWVAAFYGPDGRLPSIGRIVRPFLPVDEAGPDRTYTGLLHMNGNAAEWTRTWEIQEGQDTSRIRPIRRLKFGHHILSGERARADLHLKSAGESTRRDGATGFRCAKSVDPFGR